LLTPVFRKGRASWVNLGNIDDFSAGIPQKSSFSYVSESGYSQKEKTRFVWVVRNSEKPDRVVAFSAECTHTGCNVDWESSEEKFVCPCHEGWYDIEGQVLSGPPPKSLTQLPARTDNAEVFVRILT
ncbi:Rieske (2Fe-2S) protein, partial [bacterium]|nr:Rieske (2Fe-2S) protein [bacterium]